MPDSDVKSTVPQGLQLFYAMYAVALVFGIEQISDALYKSFKAFLAASSSWEHLAVNGALFIAILLLIVRFFWSTGNIRRAWVRAEHHGKQTAPFFLVIHLPILLLQGALVLFLCFAFADGASATAAMQPVIFWFLVVTGWNAAWLLAMVRGKRQWPETFWLANNLVLVILGAALLFSLHRGWLDPLLAVAVFAALSVGSSILDLWKTADSYLSDAGY